MQLALVAALACSTGRAIPTGQLCSYTDIRASFPPEGSAPQILASDNAPPRGGAPCFSEQKDSTIWITVASVLKNSASPADMLRRFGAISALTEVQYWSTTERAWRPMVSAAAAVDSTPTHERRADYSTADLAGSPRYYQVTDTRTYTPITYSLETHTAPQTHIVIETANVDPVKKWGITLYKPDGIHTLYILEQRTPGIWSYYSITRVVPATFLAKGDKKSYINRAVALYRHYMDLPTTTEPPAAR